MCHVAKANLSLNFTKTHSQVFTKSCWRTKRQIWSILRTQFALHLWWQIY